MFRNKEKRWLQAVILMLVLLFTAAEAFADSEHIDPDKITAESVNYHTVTAEYGDIETTLKAPGYLYYPSSVEVCHEGGDAYYEESLVNYGDKVKKGDPLLKIRAVGDQVLEEKLTIELTRAREDYETGIAEKQAALQELNERRAAAADPYEIRFLDIDIAMKALEIEQYIYETERAIAELETAVSKIREDNAVTYVFAPRDGVVADLQLFHQGDILKDGGLVCTLIDKDISFIRVDNPAYRYGSEVEITTRFANSTAVYRGEVTVTGAALPNAGFEGALIRLIDEPKDGDSFNNISVVGSDIDLRQVLLVPKETAELAGGKNVVKIVDSDNVVHKRILNIGLSTREQIWVLDGVSEGDRLVTGY